ncbi:MAG TPA: MarR family transcriptional regulator [Firmicutes bacterium]|nr:MarR family transcriptional regulator [Bacillota bacterium]
MREADAALHLRQTYQRLARIMRAKVDEYGLSFRLLHIVMLIADNPNVNQKELSERMRLTQGAISGSIKRLIKLGLVEQIPLEQDLRHNRLVVTERAKAVIADYEQHILSRYKDLFQGFTQTELKQFNQSLQKINANLDEIEKSDLKIK